MQKLWVHIRALVLGLFKRSFRSHASFHVTNLEAAKSFYNGIGFKIVTATRNNEVVLLRNHLGDELNLVVGKSNPAAASFEVPDLNREWRFFKDTQLNIAIKHQESIKCIEIVDPDGNTLSFVENNTTQVTPQIYHIATKQELTAGLSDHYYMPPSDDNRFIRVQPNAAMLVLACNQIAEKTAESPLVIELMEELISTSEQLEDFSETRSKAFANSVYPKVNSPIPRQALYAVGQCELHNNNYNWPEEFKPLEAIVS